MIKKHLIVCLVLVMILVEIGSSNQIYGEDTYGKIRGTGLDVTGTDKASHEYTDSVEPSEGFEPWDYNSFVTESRDILGYKTMDLIIDGFSPETYEIEYWDKDSYIEYQKVNGSSYGDYISITPVMSVLVDGKLKKQSSGNVMPIDVEGTNYTEWFDKNADSSYDDYLVQGKVMANYNSQFYLPKKNNSIYQDISKLYNVTDDDVYIILYIDFAPNEYYYLNQDSSNLLFGRYSTRVIKVTDDKTELGDIKSEQTVVKSELERWIERLNNNREEVNKVAGNIQTLPNKMTYSEYGFNDNYYDLGPIVIEDVEEQEFKFPSYLGFYIIDDVLYMAGNKKTGVFYGFEYFEVGSYKVPPLLFASANYVYPIIVDKDVSFIETMNNTRTSSNETMIFYIKNNGELWAFGENSRGQLGDGTFVDRIKPIKIMDDVVSVSANESGTAAIRSDGSLWVWGYTGYRYDYDGNYINRELRPYPSKIMNDVVKVELSEQSSFVLKNDGSLIGWGIGSNGELGESVSDDERYIPRLIMSDVQDISAGENFLAILKNNGDVWVSGEGAKLLMTDSQLEEDDIFLEKLENDVKSISAGALNVMMIKNDDTLWSWGYEFNRILREEPVKILENIDRVYSGYQQIAAYNNEEQLFMWGNNGFGTMGEYVKAEAIIEEPKLFDMTYIIDSENKDIKWLADEEIVLDGSDSESPIDARATNSPVEVDGEVIEFEAYNINYNNYFKLRDFATIVNGTEKQFYVGWDETLKVINLRKGEAYTTLGSEMTVGDGFTRAGIINRSKIYIDGDIADLKAYTIEGFNFFKLRDLGIAFDVSIEWDSERGMVVIDTSKGYLD